MPPMAANSATVYNWPAASLYAGVAQWQSSSLPSWSRGFDSHRPLHKWSDTRSQFLASIIGVTFPVRGEPFDYAQDRLVEPSVRRKTLRQAQGKRIIVAAISATRHQVAVQAPGLFRRKNQVRAMRRRAAALTASPSNTATSSPFSAVSKEESWWNSSTKLAMVSCRCSSGSGGSSVVEAFR